MPPLKRAGTTCALRALMVAILVGIVVTFSFRIGPTGSGILAVFPVVLTSIMLILHRRVGGKPTAAVLANAPLGLVGFGIACTACTSPPSRSALRPGLRSRSRSRSAGVSLCSPARRHGFPV